MRTMFYRIERHTEIKTELGMFFTRAEAMQQVIREEGSGWFDWYYIV